MNRFQKKKQVFQNHLKQQQLPKSKKIRKPRHQNKENLPIPELTIQPKPSQTDIKIPETSQSPTILSTKSNTPSQTNLKIQEPPISSPNPKPIINENNEEKQNQQDTIIKHLHAQLQKKGQEVFDTQALTQDEFSSLKSCFQELYDNKNNQIKMENAIKSKNQVERYHRRSMNAELFRIIRQNEIFDSINDGKLHNFMIEALFNLVKSNMIEKGWKEPEKINQNQSTMTKKERELQELKQMAENYKKLKRF